MWVNIVPKDCTVTADGMSTVGIQGRSKVLEKNSGVRATAIKATDFMKMNSSTEGRAFVKQYDLIYIYHDRIDKTGDDTTSEDKVFDAVEDEVRYIIQDGWEVQKLRNEMFSNDYGFIVDYLAEVLKTLRKEDHTHDYKKYFDLSDTITTRDKDAIS